MNKKTIFTVSIAVACSIAAFFIGLNFKDDNGIVSMKPAIVDNRDTSKQHNAQELPFQHTTIEPAKAQQTSSSKQSNKHSISGADLFGHMWTRYSDKVPYPVCIIAIKPNDISQDTTIYIVNDLEPFSTYNDDVQAKIYDDLNMKARIFFQNGYKVVSTDHQVFDSYSFASHYLNEMYPTAKVLY